MSAAFLLFSIFFRDAVKNLNLHCNDTNLNDISDISDPLDIAIKKFNNHPSIIEIRNNVNSSSNFNFNEIEITDILKEISVLDEKKRGTFKNIPAKCLKEISIECGPYLARIWNEEVVGLNKFPKDLKLAADVTPIFKKDNATQIKNYRPVSVLPTVSKIFERLMNIQIKNYIDGFLSPSRSFSFAERLDIKGAHAQISFKKIPEKAEFFYAVDTHRL